jgi:hypothetical protein
MRREKWLRENERRLRAQKQKRDKRKQNVNSSPGVSHRYWPSDEARCSKHDGNIEGVETGIGH